MSLMKKPDRLKRKPIMTVSEFRSRFGDEFQCGEHLTAQRWPNSYMASRRVHECTGCGYQGSVTAGTIFHQTRTPLTSWFWAIHRMSQDKKGISALQLSKEIHVSYPTAWLMQHKIRKAMADRDQGYQLKGLIEVDEGYVGGAEQGEAQKGRGAKSKSVVAVAVERRAPGQQGEKPIPGFAALAVIPNAAARSLHGFLHAKVQPGSQVMSVCLRLWKLSLRIIATTWNGNTGPCRPPFSPLPQAGSSRRPNCGSRRPQSRLWSASRSIGNRHLRLMSESRVS